MMTENKINDGGQAFPHRVGYSEYGGVPKEYPEFGMSLRDYFAGQALAGLYAGEGLRHTPDWYASEAYKAAVAMIAEREKEKGEINE